MNAWRTTWVQVKQSKEEFRQAHEWVYTDMLHQNAELMATAVQLAARILEYPFVSEVGLFGSTARGEDGMDVDLVVFDDGTVSRPALAELRIINLNQQLRGSSSGGAYGDVCYGQFAQHVHVAEGFHGDLYEYLRNSPWADDLIFVDQERIREDQLYLDSLAWEMPDARFFENISRDALMFDPDEHRFVRTEWFPRFVNHGVPSIWMLCQIERGEPPSRVQIEDEHFFGPDEE